jgi:hypothetical protein
MTLPKTIDGGHEPSLHIRKTPVNSRIHMVLRYGPLRATKVFATRYQFYLETKYDMVMLPENR